MPTRKMVDIDFSVLADSASIGSRWRSSPWGSRINFKIVSGAAVPTSTGSDAQQPFADSSVPMNSWAEITLAASAAAGLTAGVGVFLRAIMNENTCYRLIVNNSGYDFARFNNGTYTSLSSGTGTKFAANDRARLEITTSGANAAWELFKNDVSFASGTDTSALQGGTWGIAYSSIDATSSIKSFRAGAMSLYVDTALNARAVRAQARSGSGTQDFTISGFGIPDAAIVYWLEAGNDSDVADKLFGYSIYDGGNVFASSIHVDDGQTIADHSANWLSTKNILYQIVRGGSTYRTASATFITDGLRFTFDGNSGQPYVTVILFKGGIKNVVATYCKPSATVAATTTMLTGDWLANTIFAIADYRDVVDSGGTIGRIAVGAATYKNGAITQYSVGDGEGVNIPSNPSDLILNDRMAFNKSGQSGASKEYELTSVVRGTLTVTTREGGSGEAYTGHLLVLAFELDTPAEIFIADTPSSAVAWSPFTGTNFPAAVLMLPNRTTAIDTPTAEHSGLGLYVVTDDAEEFGGFSISQYNVNPVNTSGRIRSDLFLQDGAAGAPDFTAISPSFRINGLSYTSGNITASGGVSHKVLGISFPVADWAKFRSTGQVNAVSGLVGLSGAYTDIDESVDSPDGSWLTKV